MQVDWLVGCALSCTLGKLARTDPKVKQAMVPPFPDPAGCKTDEAESQRLTDLGLRKNPFPAGFCERQASVNRGGPPRTLLMVSQNIRATSLPSAIAQSVCKLLHGTLRPGHVRTLSFPVEVGTCLI